MSPLSPMCDFLSLCIQRELRALSPLSPMCDFLSPCKQGELRALSPLSLNSPPIRSDPFASLAVDNSLQRLTRSSSSSSRGRWPTCRGPRQSAGFVCRFHCSLKTVSRSGRRTLQSPCFSGLQVCVCVCVCVCVRERESVCVCVCVCV